MGRLWRRARPGGPAAAAELVMLSGLRYRIGRWVFGGRIRLGDGLGLEPIAAADLESIRRRFPRPKFFIFGHARSGTSLLARLIRLHPEVHCEWQTQFFSDRGPIAHLTSASFQAWLRHPSNRWTTGWDPTASLLRVACDEILERQAEQVGKRIVGDKSPNENAARAIRWLAAVYPDASLIYIIRDGRDTVLSKRIQAFIDQPEALGRSDRVVRRDLIADPAPFLAKRRSIFTPAWLAEAARAWGDSVQESVAAGRELFGDRLAVLRYEDLLAEPRPVLERLWAHLGATGGDDTLAEAIEGETGRNPEAAWHSESGFAFVRELPRGVQGAWRAIFTHQDVEVFNRGGGKVLEAWGYDRSEVER